MQTTEEGAKGRLIIVSNRLPVILKENEDDYTVVPSSGGLVTALAPVLKNRGGVWLGWTGLADVEDVEKIKQLLQTENEKTGFQLCPLFLSKKEIKNYYEGFANGIIWPLFHDLTTYNSYDPSLWNTYIEVNRKFAESLVTTIQPHDFLWVHDYHLLLVGQELRHMQVKEKIGFFLHIPFPSPDIFIKLPWRFDILRALLEYDLVGFQTTRDERNFVQCVKKLLPNLKISNNKSIKTCVVDDREVRIGAFPISVDFHYFSSQAGAKEITKRVGITDEQLKGEKIIFSCDRLDISKGILCRLEAIRYFLKNNPELHGKVKFFQVVVPSRVDVPQYAELKDNINKLVSEINSEFTQTGWVPILYVFHSISQEELLSFYRVSAIALITPIKDGMNLVSKEFIASAIHNNGVLILSEFAGAAIQLQKEALLVNPYDVKGVAETILRALNMPLEEIKKRMKQMRRQVQRYDVFWWVRTYLSTAISRELKDFPLIEEYVPKEEG